MVSKIDIDLSGVGDKIAHAVQEALKNANSSAAQTTGTSQSAIEVSESIARAFSEGVTAALEDVVENIQKPDAAELREQILTNAKIMMRLTARGDDVFAVSKPRPLQIIITGKAPNLSADVLAFYVQQKRDYIPPHTRRVEARLESRWKEVAVLRGSTAATDLDALQSLLEVSKAAVAGTAERSAQEEADWVEQGMDEDYSSCRISWGLWASPMS